MPPKSHVMRQRSSSNGRRGSLEVTGGAGLSGVSDSVSGVSDSIIGPFPQINDVYPPSPRLPSSAPSESICQSPRSATRARSFEGGRSDSEVNLGAPGRVDEIMETATSRLVRSEFKHHAAKKSNCQTPRRRESRSSRAAEAVPCERQRRQRQPLLSQSLEHDEARQSSTPGACQNTTPRSILPPAVETARKRRCLEYPEVLLGSEPNKMPDHRRTPTVRRVKDCPTHNNSVDLSSCSSVASSVTPSSIYTVDPQLAWLRAGRPRPLNNGAAQSRADDVSSHHAITIPAGGNTLARTSANSSGLESQIALPTRGKVDTIRVFNTHDSAASDAGGVESTIASEIELLGSVLEGGIFQSVHEPGSGLGLPSEPDRKAQHARLRKTFRWLRRTVESHQAKARLELFQIYNVVRDPFFDCDTVKLLRLMGLISTLAGASAALSFTEHQVLIRDESDPIMRLDSVVQTLFLFICYLHPKKKLDIMALLHRCFEQSKQAPQPPANAPTAAADAAILQLHKEQIFSFLMWMMGAGGYVAVFTFVKLHVQEIDSALLRRFLELVFQYCLPPFSTSFAEAWIDLLHDLLCIHASLDLSNSKNFYICTLVSQLVPHAIRAWSPMRPPSEVLGMMNALQAHIDPGQFGHSVTSETSSSALAGGAD